MKLDDKPITDNARARAARAHYRARAELRESRRSAISSSLLDTRPSAQSDSERSYIEQNEKLPPEKRLSRQEAAARR